jgi:hypothetical protein
MQHSFGSTGLQRSRQGLQSVWYGLMAIGGAPSRIDELVARFCPIVAVKL